MLNNLVNIIKYDWLRRWKFFLAGLVVFTLVNVDIAGRIITNGQPSFFSGLLIAVLFAMAGGLVFDHLGRMYKLLFSDEGIFVFSTPLSGYNILGGKILAVILEYLGVVVFVTIVALIDHLILRQYFPGMHLPEGALLSSIVTKGLQVNLLILLSYISFILTAYLSMALSKSLFSSVKYGGLLSFVIFIAITQAFPRMAMVFAPVSSFHISITPDEAAFTGYWLTAVAFAIAVVAVLFVATGYLLDRKVNV